MTRHEFAEKAISGGYMPGGKPLAVRCHEDGAIEFKYSIWTDSTFLSFDELVLDVRAWEAVGEVLKWNEMPRMMLFVAQDRVIQRAKDEDFRRMLTRETRHIPWPQLMLYRLIDARSEGKTVDEYLATL